MLWGLHSLFWCMCSWFTLLSQSGEPYAFCIDIVNFILVRSIAKWIYMIQIHQSGSWSRICEHGRCKKLTGREENGITNLTYLLKDRFKCYKFFLFIKDSKWEMFTKNVWSKFEPLWGKVNLTGVRQKAKAWKSLQPLFFVWIKSHFIGLLWNY